MFGNGLNRSTAKAINQQIDKHLIDDNGVARNFFVQLFNNSYQTLVLGRGLKVNSQKRIFIGSV